MPELISSDFPEAFIFLAHNNAADGTAAVPYLTAVTAIRTCGVGVKIDRIALIVPDKGSGLGYAVDVQSPRISFIQRRKTAFAYGEFTVGESHPCVDVVILEIGDMHYFGRDTVLSHHD